MFERTLKYVYISGKYTSADDDYNEVERYIAVARDAAMKLSANGVAYYCPHLHSAHFDLLVPNTSYEFWMEMCLKYLADTDAILMLPNWLNSSGAKREKAEAAALALPVFYNVEDAIRWAKS